MTAIWYNSVLDYLANEGHDVVPSDIKQLEELLIRKGLAKEYLASLCEVTGCDGQSDEERVLSLALASSVERLKAIKILLGNSSEARQGLTLPRYLSLYLSEL